MQQRDFGWDKPETKSTSHSRKLRPVQDGITGRKMDAFHPLKDDMKYGDLHQPYFGNLKGQQSLAQAIEEYSYMNSAPKPARDVGTEELIRRLLQEEMCE